MFDSLQNQQKIANDKKIENLKSIDTYVRVKCVKISKKIQILFTCIVYKIKKDLHSKILRYKIRYVVRDFIQKKETNFQKIYIVVVKTISFKILFAIIARQNFNCKQINIVIVFLNLILQELIYVESSKNYRKNKYT